MLAYDERMLLHRDESARGSPHPERPDRIRAVMARLDRAGLTGAASLFCSCSPLSSPHTKAVAMHQETALSCQLEPEAVAPSGATLWQSPSSPDLAICKALLMSPYTSARKSIKTPCAVLPGLLLPALACTGPLTSQARSSARVLWVPGPGPLLLKLSGRTP